MRFANKPLTKALAAITGNGIIMQTNISNKASYLTSISPYQVVVHQDSLVIYHLPNAYKHIIYLALRIMQ